MRKKSSWNLLKMELFKEYSLRNHVYIHLTVRKQIINSI